MRLKRPDPRPDPLLGKNALRLKNAIRSPGKIGVWIADCLIR